MYIVRKSTFTEILLSNVTMLCYSKLIFRLCLQPKSLNHAYDFSKN